MIYNGGRAAVGEQMTTHWGSDLGQCATRIARRPSQLAFVTLCEAFGLPEL